MIDPIDLIFQDDPQAAQDQAAEPFERFISAPRRPLVLLGAGEVGKNILAVLRPKGVEILCFADNNPLKWGTTFEGLAVHSPREAARIHGRRAAFVVAFKCADAVYRKEERRLKGYGAEIVCPMSLVLCKWPEISGWPAESIGFYREREKQVRAVWELLGDPQSREQLLGHLRWRVLHDYPSLPSGEIREQYFCEDLIRLSDQESFVDGGAFDGDTIATFLYDRCENFAHIHAFEPDPKSFSALQSYVGRLKADLADRISVYPFALSDRAGQASFTALGNHSSTLGGLEGATSVQTVALDDLLHGQQASFLKFDLEGGERPALRGSTRIIQAQRPILTIAVYHHPADLIEIPLLVRERCEDYRFHLRTHNSFGLDIVLYAVPAERSI